MKWVYVNHFYIFDFVEKWSAELILFGFLVLITIICCDEQLFRLTKI